MGASGRCYFGVDDPRRARAGLQHASDSKYCVRCGSPLPLRRRLRRAPREYRCASCGHARPASTSPRGDRARRARRHLVRFVRRTGKARGARGSGPLQRLQRARRRVAGARLGAGLDESPRASSGSGCVREVRALRGRRPERPPLLIKNPGGRQRGVRTLGRGRPRDARRRAQRPDRRRKGRLVDLGRRLRADLRARERIVVSGERAAELGSALHLRGLPKRRGWSSFPTSRPPSTAGSTSRPRTASSSCLPTYTAMLDLRAIATDEASRGRTGSVRERDPPRRPSLPRVPQHLRRPRQHRRLTRRAAARGHELSVDAGHARDGARAAAATTCSMSAGARIASRR